MLKLIESNELLDSFPIFFFFFLQSLDIIKEKNFEFG